MNNAILIGGGGLKGGLSYGGIKALDEILGNEGGINQNFQVIAGTSAGAATAWYTLAGQFYEHGEKIWTEKVATKDFVDIRRAFSGNRPILDSEHLIQDVFRRSDRKLNLEAMLNSSKKYFFPVTNKRTNEAEYWGNLQEDEIPDGRIFHHIGDMTEDEIYNLMQATISAPIVNGGSVEFRGEMYTDGAIADPIPDITLLPKEGKKIIFVTKDPSSEQRNWYENFSRNRGQRYEEMLREVEKRDDVLVIYPSRKLSSIKNDEQTLINNIDLGYSDVMRRKEEILRFLGR